MVTPEEIKSILEQEGIEIFDSDVLPKNCQLIFDTYVNQGQVLYQEAISRINNSHKTDVVFFANNRLSSNASVSLLPEKNIFLVCFNYGLIANIYACFTSLLSHPEVLPQIGNPANTSCSFNIAKNGLTDFTYYNNEIKANIPVSMGFPVLSFSEDKERLLYSRLLTDITMEFCMYHEWGHIIGGHVQYASITQHIQQIPEINSETKNSIPGKLNGLLIRNIMEFEADFIASSILINLPLRLQSSKSTKFHTYPESFIEKYDMRDAIHFALLTFFHLMQEVRMISNKGWDAHYPIPYYRFLSLLHAIGETKNKDEKMLWGDYEFRGAEDFLRASLRLNLAPKLGFAFIAHVYDEDITKKSIIKLAKSVEKLKDYLQDYRLTSSQDKRDNI